MDSPYLHLSPTHLPTLSFRPRKEQTRDPIVIKEKRRANRINVQQIIKNSDLILSVNQTILLSVISNLPLLGFFSKRVSSGSSSIAWIISSDLQFPSTMYGFEAMTFNIHGGYLEAIVRGHRSGLLTAADYNNLCQCETLDDIKMHLSATEYGPYLQNGTFWLHIWWFSESSCLL